MQGGFICRWWRITSLDDEKNHLRLFFFSVQVLFCHDVFSMSAHSYCPLQFRSPQYAFFCVPLSHPHHRVLTWMSSEHTPRCFLLCICLFSCLIVLVCGKLRQHIPTTRSWVVAQNLRSKNTVNINIKPFAAIFPPKPTISISTLSSGAQPVRTTDPRELVLLRGWRQNHCQHQRSVRVLDLNGLKSNDSEVKLKSFSSSLCLGTCLGKRLTGWHLFYLEFNTQVKKSLFQVPSSERR